MIYTGKISDEAGLPIPGAALRFTLPDGTAIDYTLPVDGLGHWSIDTNTDGGLLDSDNTVEFSAPGFYAYSISAAQIPQTFNVTLTKKVNKTGLILAGVGIGVAALLLMDKKRKVGAAETEQKKKFSLPSWVIPVAAVGTGVALVWNFFNKPDPKEKDSAQLAVAAAQHLKDLENQGQVTTISDAECEALSATIVQATDDCGTDTAAIYDVFRQLYSEADFWTLVKVFGTRQIKSCFGGNWFTDTPYNLPQIINEELSDSEKLELNNILIAHGISYTFK